MQTRAGKPTDLYHGIERAQLLSPLTTNTHDNYLHYLPDHCWFEADGQRHMFAYAKPVDLGQNPSIWHTKPEEPKTYFTLAELESWIVSIITDTRTKT